MYIIPWYRIAHSELCAFHAGQSCTCDVRMLWKWSAVAAWVIVALVVVVLALLAQVLK
jgi:hypothetical protein